MKYSTVRVLDPAALAAAPSAFGTKALGVADHSPETRSQMCFKRFYEVVFWDLKCLFCAYFRAFFSMMDSYTCTVQYGTSCMVWLCSCWKVQTWGHSPIGLVNCQVAHPVSVAGSYCPDHRRLPGPVREKLKNSMQVRLEHEGQGSASLASF